MIYKSHQSLKFSFDFWLSLGLTIIIIIFFFTFVLSRFSHIFCSFHLICLIHPVFFYLRLFFCDSILPPSLRTGCVSFLLRTECASSLLPHGMCKSPQYVCTEFWVPILFATCDLVFFFSPKLSHSLLHRMWFPFAFFSISSYLASFLFSLFGGLL